MQINPRLRAIAAAALLVSTASLSVPAPVRAWSATGHMTIDAIAEPRLNPNARKNVERLIPLVNDPRSPDFITAGVWMDDIRADGVRLYDRWHYDLLAFSPDGTPFPQEPHADHVAWAVAQNAQTLRSEKASDAEKARSLRFLMHTLGDAHNPVHAGTRFTKENPKGDSGANDFALEENPTTNPNQYKNLHAMWDGALGTFPRFAREMPRTEKEERVRKIAATLVAKYPESSFPEIRETDPQKWVEEGGKLLVSDVY
ncbi:MAG: S1/P1 nuclease, partial [Cytophagales bacterium]|nr:S1/P1 nuclease [Armatimonadota bacterium]